MLCITRSGRECHIPSFFTSVLTTIVAYYNDFETIGRIIRMKKLEFVADYVPEVAISKLAAIELNLTLTRDEFTTGETWQTR